MFPGFVTYYKDNENFIHLNFYPGIDDNNTPIYRKIDLSKSGATFDEKLNSDGSYDFKFFNKTITSITCRLVNDKNGKVDYDNLEIK